MNHLPDPYHSRGFNANDYHCRYKFRFYSSDINEPPHVHVIRDNNVAKIWLQPVEIEYNHGYSQPKLNRVLKLTRQNQARLLEAWNDHFSQ